MTYITKTKGGKSQVNKEEALISLSGGNLPDDIQSLKALFGEYDAKIKSIDSKITSGALSNVHGDWYEWLLAIKAWNYCVDTPEANLALLTPNVTRFKITTLYVDKLHDLITDLKNKVSSTSSVQLISSNPDFVILNRDLVNKIIPLKRLTKIDKTTINQIENCYKKFVGECNFEDIVGYMSVKTSFRPDRRLQIPHEGSLMKAIYTHLQTREWIINPKGLKYYAFATEVGAADRTALKTVATHSITTVHSVPQAAVDDVFQVDTMQQAQNAFARILHF